MFVYLAVAYFLAVAYLLYYCIGWRLAVLE